MINGKEIFLVARNPKKEKSHCIGKKVGAYEISGVILVGNIEDHDFIEMGIDPVVHGEDIFNRLNYELISTNIANAATTLGGLEYKI